MNPLPGRIQWFKHGDKYYGYGTRVEFSEKFISEQEKLGKKIYKYGEYKGTYFNQENQRCHDFIIDDSDIIKLQTKNEFIDAAYGWLEISKCLSTVTIIGPTIEDEIARFREARIINPEKDNVFKHKCDLKNPKLVVGWIVVLFIMFEGLIFNWFVILWPIIALLFSAWREDVIWEEKIKQNDHKDF